MTTFSTGQGLVLQENNAGDILAVQSSVLEIVVADAITSFTYSVIGTDSDGLPLADILITSFDVRFDGVTDSVALSANTDAAVLEILWNGGANSTYILNLFDDDTNLSYVYVIGGDDIPSLATPADVNNFLAGATIRAPLAGSGFEPGDAISLSGIPDVTITENDVIPGTGVDDSIDSGAGNDSVNGQGGDDTLTGGSGDDTISGGDGANEIDGGSGVDTLDFSTATGRAFADIQIDQRGAGFLAFYDVGQPQGDTYAGLENITGGDFADNLRGDSGSNHLQGGGVSDRLYGRGGDDILDGGTGADALYGNLGADTMTGGPDAGRRDRFIFFEIAESGVGAGNRDVITDFVPGEDRIEISRFDADINTGGRQAFSFIGDAGFSGAAGELGYVQVGGNTIVQADVDGDGLADFEIELNGLLTLTVDDFLI